MDQSCDRDVQPLVVFRVCSAVRCTCTQSRTRQLQLRQRQRNRSFLSPRRPRLVSVTLHLGLHHNLVVRRKHSRFAIAIWMESLALLSELGLLLSVDVRQITLSP